MPASVIDPATFEDEWFGQLSDREMILWVGVFGRLRDDQGRFVENAALARARLFPYRDVPVDDIQAAFDRFVKDERLHRYTDGERTLLQIITWWEHQKPQWAAPSKLPAPEGWTDRVRHRHSGAYQAVDWESPGGFARSVQAKDSGEGLTRTLHTKGSEPEPEPEPEPFKSTPTAAKVKGPVDNSAKPERGCSIELNKPGPEPPSDQVAGNAAALDVTTSDDPETCDGKPCAAHDFPRAAHAPLRRAILASLHPEQYNAAGPKERTVTQLMLEAYAGHVCTACQDALAEFERPQRDDLCEQAVVAAVESLKGSQDVAAVMKTRIIKAPGLSALIGDRKLEELRRTKRQPQNRAKTSEPRHIGEVLCPPQEVAAT